MNSLMVLPIGVFAICCMKASIYVLALSTDEKAQFRLPNNKIFSVKVCLKDPSREKPHEIEDEDLGSTSAKELKKI